MGSADHKVLGCAPQCKESHVAGHQHLGWENVVTATANVPIWGAVYPQRQLQGSDVSRLPTLGRATRVPVRCSLLHLLNSHTMKFSISTERWALLKLIKTISVSLHDWLTSKRMHIIRRGPLRKCYIEALFLCVYTLHTFQGKQHFDENCKKRPYSMHRAWTV